METCKHFKGDRPCKYYWVDRSKNCGQHTCLHYDNFNERILLIKLDALGDVVRSTALVEGLKKKHKNSQITWLVAPEGEYFLKDNPFIDRIITYNTETVRQLQVEKFDILINLDKDPKATSMAMLFNSKIKRGYGLSDEGYVIPLNDSTKHSYFSSLDNWGAKIKDTKSYQELIFNISEVEYNNEQPKIYLNDEGNFKNIFYKKYNINKKDKIIILNTGSSNRFQHRIWTKKGYRELIKKLLKNTSYKIILAGSKLEIDRNNYIAKDFNVINTTNHYNLKEFVFLLQLADVIVTGETVAMHIGISLSKKMVGFWGSLPPQLVDFFGLGKKHYNKELKCLGCYGQFKCPYNAKCMTSITANEVYKSIEELIRTP